MTDGNESINRIVEMADALYRKRDYENALDLYTKASRYGSIRSTLMMGKMYTKGYGTLKQPKKGFEILLNAKDDGNPQSLFELGRCYFEGIGTECDRQTGFELIANAAMSGYEPAENYIGEAYIHGVYVEMDPDEGLRWIERSAKKQYPRSIYNLAMEYDSGSFYKKDSNKAFSLMKKAANLGYTEAEYKLGTWYLDGVNTEVDFELGERYLQNAFDNGNGPAGVELGQLYDDSEDIEDLKKAENYFKRAAAKGETKAMFCLARLYNKHTPLKDRKKETIWLKRGYDKKDPDCIWMYGVMLMRDDDTPDHEEKAFRIFKEGADMGNVRCIEWWGYCKENGIGTSRDVEEAVRWYDTAISKSSGYAFFRKGLLYKGRYGIKKSNRRMYDCLKRAVHHHYDLACHELGFCYEHDEEQVSMADAIFWYKEGVKKKVPESMIAMAEHYESGTYVELSEMKAFALYSEAYDIDHSPIAAANIGRFYEEGIYVEKDIDKAIEWYIKAARRNNAFAMNHLFHIYSERGGSSKANVFWLQRSAKGGNKESMLELANEYEMGGLVPRSTSDAVYWYHKAADEGNEYARKKFEELVFNEEECDPEFNTKLSKLERDAGERRDNDALMELGRTYLYGDDVTDVDLDEARSWFVIADQMGVRDAKRYLEEIDMMSSEEQNMFEKNRYDVNDGDQ